MKHILELRGVAKHFGALRAVDDVSFSVTAGSRHAVIGPNGAGKSTLFGIVSGALRATGGTVVFDGRDLTRMAEHARAGLGIGRTFQHSSLFLHETVLENVLVAALRRAGLAHRWLRPVTRHRGVAEAAREMLDRVGLAERADVPAGALSHGERRQLEVAVALACEPRLLLLDEPAAGMSPAETKRFTGLIRSLPDEITVLLVEHDLDVVFGLADTVTVMHLGGHLMTGGPEEVRASDEVQTAYLGAADTSELFPGGGR